MNYDDINLKIMKIFGLDISQDDRIFAATIKLRPQYPPTLVLERYVDAESNEEKKELFKIEEIQESQSPTGSEKSKTG